MAFAYLAPVSSDEWRVRTVRASLPTLLKVARKPGNIVAEIRTGSRKVGDRMRLTHGDWIRTVQREEIESVTGINPRRRNPDVIRKPSASVVSEQNALAMIRQLAADIAGGTLKEARDNAATIVGYCDVLLGQVKSGIHANPTLATFMATNPPNVFDVLALFSKNPAMQLMSRHVQAICYKHAKDGQFYIHTFGGSDVPFHVRDGRQYIFLDELPTTTGVDMRSDKRVVVFSRPDGKPLADDF